MNELQPLSRLGVLATMVLLAAFASALGAALLSMLPALLMDDALRPATVLGLVGLTALAAGWWALTARWRSDKSRRARSTSYHDRM